LLPPRPPSSTLSPYTTLFRSRTLPAGADHEPELGAGEGIPGFIPLLSSESAQNCTLSGLDGRLRLAETRIGVQSTAPSVAVDSRSEEHTSELQSRRDLVCRPL